MNKADLISAVASDLNQSKASATEIVDSVLGKISESLTAGEDVALFGFGTFSVTTRAARDGRNPKTGETIKIEASKGVKFKATKALKEAL